MVVQKLLLQEKMQRNLLFNHTILSWLKYLEEKPLKMLIVQTIQMLLVLVVVAAVVVLVKAAAAAVIVNNLIIPLICEHVYFVNKN